MPQRDSTCAEELVAIGAHPNLVILDSGTLDERSDARWRAYRAANPRVLFVYVSKDAKRHEDTCIHLQKPVDERYLAAIACESMPSAIARRSQMA